MVCASRVGSWPGVATWVGRMMGWLAGLAAISHPNRVNRSLGSLLGMTEPAKQGAELTRPHILAVAQRAGTGEGTGEATVREMAICNRIYCMVHVRSSLTRCPAAQLTGW